MKIVKTAVLSIVCALMLIGTVQSAPEEKSAEAPAALKGIKLGFGFDQGFSIVGNMGSFYGALGDKGFAVDYNFIKKKFNAENPLYWYVSAGGYGEWDGDFGVRLPIGAEIYFAKNLDAYAQLMPRLRFNNNDANDNTDLGLDFAIGVRYQF